MMKVYSNDRIVFIHNLLKTNYKKNPVAKKRPGFLWNKSGVKNYKPLFLVGLVPGWSSLLEEIERRLDYCRKGGNKQSPFVPMQAE